MSMNDAVNDTESTAGVKSQLNGDESRFQLCPELYQFYKRHNLELSTTAGVASNPYRFVRLNPCYDRSETLELLERELQDSSDGTNTTHERTRLLEVPWLDRKWGFYALSSFFALSSSECYRSGRVYGMDINSGASVAALLTDRHDQSKESAIHVSSTTDQKDSVWSTTDQKDSGGEIRVLDLCTCPGLKLMMITDFFSQIYADSGDGNFSVKVVGVDINSNRMDKCKAIVEKYLVNPATSGKSILTHDIVNVQLYLADGTTFASQYGLDLNTSLVFDSRVAAKDVSERGKRKRLNKSARARQKKRLRQIASCEWTIPAPDDVSEDCADQRTKKSKFSVDRFDYVLVDAECSTDGSFKHIRERIKGFHETHSPTLHLEDNSRLTNHDKLSDLVALQRRLIESGFRLLKPGGSMVYSTCSLSVEQNEKVVAWLLDMNPDAVLKPIHFPLVMKSKFVGEGSLKGTVRFYPNFSERCDPEPLLIGDGFFVAKIVKRKYPASK